ncbi:o-succinylbenzoate--CoA ligase [Peribacillus muralis]|uniref:o-succinylbenzoate--CoA ligase n=1 Tax=Peribacillus muralis TaxID=264697 RepID=UPI001F4E8FE3|nr:o-succinylbenzoate--CoA ligase [Peribacillus muralis]MCK1994881.1 o-succinylbenzoate--CoA ligase [Peribacillus muralis]MCK2015292.1 o-succinylbenzoate--CoA ligase [Peribacillus muralis]
MAEEKLPNWLKNRAHLSPDRPAIEFEGQTYSFLELHTLSEKMACRLASAGLKSGDTSAVLFRNHIDGVVAIHALFYLGVKIVMLNNKLTAKELAWQIEDSGASYLVSERSFASKLDDIDGILPDLPLLLIEHLPVEGAAEILQQFYLEDTATIMYTSGTTGNPKGVIQTFGNHWWSAVGSVLNLGLHEGDSWYCAVPIFHVSGLSILMKSVIYGMKVVLAERFDEREANRAIQERGVTIISVVPTMLNRMVHDLKESGYPDSFRCILLGGGPAPVHLLEACKEKKIPVYQSYGMTETSSQIVTLAPEYSMTKIGSAGKPLFPSQLKVEQDGKLCEPGMAGEIVVSGPNVTKGYFNRLDATQQAIIDGWLYTGDLGYLDEEGFLYVLDRRSDLIISGGENVYPAEIENVLSRHPDVFEAGVTGTEDEKWGQVPLAFVVLHQGAEQSESDLLDYCRESLASYKIPRNVIFCDRLPRNGASKLLRRELKKKMEEWQ